MSIYKDIKKSETSINEIEVYKTFSLDSGSIGINSIQYRSGSILYNSNGLPTVSGSYWNSLLVCFYLSGSDGSKKEDKYNSSFYSKGLSDTANPQHRNKFFDTGSILSIPQKYFGESIRKETFILTDKSHPSGSVTIKDDGYGNLYAVDNHISRSNNNSSSFDNYVGNIFYEYGVVTITETGSCTHTPSTASITVGTINQSIPSSSNFFITSSNLSTSIKFVSTGSYASETETSTLKFFASGSTTALTALSASKKINDTFGGTHITSSVSSNVVNLTNDANLMSDRTTTNLTDNLPPISGSGGFNTTTGFGGGKSIIKYTDILTGKYNLQFDSRQIIFVKQYSLVVHPHEFNFSNNPTARGFLSTSVHDSSILAAQSASSSPVLRTDLTGSGWSPYMTTIGFYEENDTEPVMIARYPQPIKMRDDMTLIFKINMDY